VLLCALKIFSNLPQGEDESHTGTKMNFISINELVLRYLKKGRYFGTGRVPSANGTRAADDSYFIKEMTKRTRLHRGDRHKDSSKWSAADCNQITAVYTPNNAYWLYRGPITESKAYTTKYGGRITSSVIQTKLQYTE
jgi:hypothetical protein